MTFDNIADFLINNADLFLGAIIGAILSVFGFIINYIIDEKKHRKQKKHRIKALANMCIYSYLSNDRIRSQDILFQIIIDCYDLKSNISESFFSNLINMSYSLSAPKEDFSAEMELLLQNIL